MSVKTKIMPVSLGVLLMAPNVWGASSTWDCKAGPGKTWECKTVDTTKPRVVTPTQTSPTTGSTTTNPATTSQQPVFRESAPSEENIQQPGPIAARETYGMPARRPARKSSGPRIDRDLDWGQCGPLYDPGSRLIGKSDETQIISDSADVSRESKEARFSGNVVVTKNGQLLEADRIIYNNQNDTFEAKGYIYYQKPGLLVSGSHAKMYMEENKGRIKDVQYRLPKRRARGSANLVEIIDKDKSKYENINYTTCRPGNNDWVLEAGTLEIDQASGVGVAEDTVFRFQGIPFFYLPYASFPIDDRRKSGFLVPSIGNSDETGFDVSAPYYINIAPDMDATITPRYMSKRGLMIAGEFRYLTENYSSETVLELLPNDKDRKSNLNSNRGAFSYEGYGWLTPRLLLDVDASFASDENYLEDLGDSLAISSKSYLDRRADITYTGNNWYIRGSAEYYQSMDDTISRIDRPYARLPQVYYSYIKPDAFMGATVHLNAQYDYFDHSSSQRVKGHRFDINPGVSVPMRSSWGYVTPKLTMHHTSYNLKDRNDGGPDSPDRTTGTFSLDSGLYFDRVEETSTSTLEPRLFYVYTPHENQDDIPVFDSAEYDFSFYNLFRENRFSGRDRISDANQLTLAVTSRTFNNLTGEEFFRLSLGETFYFEDREVHLPDATDEEIDALNDTRSAFVGQIAAQLSRSWSTQADLEWDPNPNDNNTIQSALHLRYNNQDKTLFNLGYRYARGLFEETDVSFRVPLSTTMNAVGRWDYSLRNNQTVEAFAGVEYSNCCWALRAVGRQYINDTEADTNTAFYLQIEFKGLTSVGNKVDDFLEDNILGYSKPE